MVQVMIGSELRLRPATLGFRDPGVRVRRLGVRGSLGLLGPVDAMVQLEVKPVPSPCHSRC